MPLPAEVQTVTVNFGPFKDFLGVALKGETIFTPSTAVQTSTGVPLVNAPMPVVWDGSGSGSITLPATDSTGIDRTGWTYEVRHRTHTTGVPAPRGGIISLPAAAPVVDLEDLVDTEVSTGLVIAQPAVVSVAGLTGAPSAEELVEALDDPLRAAFAPRAETPTLEELERVALLGTISATQVMRLGPTSFDQRIGGLTLAAAAAVAASDTNYWTVSLLRLRAGQNPLTVVTRTTKVTGGEAFTTDQGWNYDAVTWLETARHLRKGDVLALSFTKTGTPADLVAVTAAVRYEPGVQPLIRDTFTRADSTSSLGVTDTGQTWEAPLAGTLGVAGGKGYASALSSGFAYDLFDSGRSDYTLSVVISTAGASQGLAFRTTDYNNLWDAGGSGVTKTAAGVTTTVIGGIGGLATGDVLTVAVSGPSISLYKNGTLIGSATDAFNQTATKVGIWAADTNSRLDDLMLAD